MYAEEYHDLAVERIEMFPQFPSAGKATTISVTISNRGNFIENNVKIELLILDFDFMQTIYIPSISPNSYETFSITWTPQQIPETGIIHIRATLDPVPGEKELENNGLDYKNIPRRDFMG